MTTALPERGEVIHSPWIGDVEWDSSSELLFAHGLPGFEDHRRMVPVEIPVQRPLVYLQSIESADVCFLCLPVRVIDAGFTLEMSEDERASIFLPEDCAPEIGVDVLCLGLLVPSGRTVAVNLGAPIVINLHNGRCVQCVPRERESSRFRLGEDGKWETAC
ncbi:MAG TPA: flagellar assembly protein FliW [Bryobacteraceae bacterium]|jgi:flagellar assembly factor FliW|nr:flagellar assembly protein FliW [Bryobacteraceae bacterium]